MNAREKRALKRCHLDIVRDLNPVDVCPFLFQRSLLSDDEYEDILELIDRRGRREASIRLLTIITGRQSRCTFQGFIDSLNYEHVYYFLADKLLACLDDNTRVDPVYNDDETDPKKVNDGSDDEEESEEASFDEESREIINMPVSRINVFTKRRQKMAAFAHKLKRLSHEGNRNTLEQVTSMITQNFTKHKISPGKDIQGKMELADMQFTALEAEASSKRVMYDVSLSESDTFRGMESVIPFTSNPRVSSMTYLARYGSAVSMTSTIQDGLAYIEYAKHHAEYITPCKDTGMVYYIEVNLLSQLYEQDPSIDLKGSILKTATTAIAQFANEDDVVRKDYERMLLLKMAFCHLGIGLFGKRIESVESTDKDKDAAKNCFDFIEKADVWEGMEKRRKMLFYIAKAEYFKQQNMLDMAAVFAKEAFSIAEANSWQKELENIQDLSQCLKELKASMTKEAPTPTLHDILGDMLEDLDDVITS